MKKVIVLLIAVTSFTAAFSQPGNNRSRTNDHDRHENVKPKTNDHYPQAHSNEYGYNQNDRRYNERNRQAEIDRVNRDYDNRVYAYRNNHSINRYERNRMIRQAEMERSQKIKSFGGGVIVGAVAGLVLGALISH